MEAKNGETQAEKPKITAYTEEEIIALIDFAWTVSSPDFNNGSHFGQERGKGTLTDKKLINVS